MTAEIASQPESLFGVHRVSAVDSPRRDFWSKCVSSGYGRLANPRRIAPRLRRGFCRNQAGLGALGRNAARSALSRPKNKAAGTNGPFRQAAFLLIKQPPEWSGGCLFSAAKTAS